MSRKTCIAAVFFVFAGLNTALFAWNDLGHITVARIAYSRLSDGQRAAVADMLRKHPHYEVYFKRPEGLDVPEDEYMFLRAATWSDFVRPPRGMSPEDARKHPIYKYHRGPWHYVNYPLKPGMDTSKLPEPLIPTETLKTSVVEQLGQTHEILLHRAADPGQVAGSTEAENRAVRLCWLFHLVGDLHQPLHAVALVNQELFPGPNYGDNGGNFIMIRTSERAAPSNLHAFWDNLLGFSRGWRDGKDAAKLRGDVDRARQLSELLTHNPEYSLAKLPELRTHRKYADWALESFQLAASVGYDQGNLKFVAQKQLNEHPELKQAVPVLPPLMQEKARAVANRRVTLAGYRLAAEIEQLVKP